MNFSIIIVSWNNPSCLKTIINSINKNSYYKHEILVFLNEKNQESIDFLKSQQILFLISDINIGLPKAANLISKYAIEKYICLIDDDIYVLPDWDLHLLAFKTKNNLPECSWISSTMIEPEKGGVTVISPYNFGRNPNEFDEIKLLSEYKYLSNFDYVSNQATPLLISKTCWDQIGGYPEEFNMGIGSEEGLAKKMYDIGCRDFVGVGKSLVYHFQRISTKKLNNYSIHAQNRTTQFKELFDMSESEFLNIIKKGSLYVSSRIS